LIVVSIIFELVKCECAGTLLLIFSMFDHGFLVYSFLVESQWEILVGSWLW